MERLHRSIYLMGVDSILAVLYESLYAIIAFGLFLSYATFKGRQAAMNLILGLYLALLLSMQFPYFNSLATSAGSATSQSIIQIGIFMVFTVAATALFGRLMPDEFLEKTFESFGKKILIAFVATVLLLAFTYQVLPIGELIDTSTPLQSLFSNSEYFFWWLLLPLVVLFFI